MRRLVIGHILAFGMITLVGAAASYLVARHELTRRLDSNIAARFAAAEEKWRSSGPEAMEVWIDTLSRRGGHFAYIVTAPDGRRLRTVEGVGAVADGWGMTRFDDEDDGENDPARTLTKRLPDGSRLTIVADRDYIEQFDTVLIGFLGVAVPLLLATAIVGSLSLEASVRRRLGQVNATVAAIMDGDLSQRVPSSGTRDEFDELSRTVNRMLDRINALLGEVRRVTAYVAHDLRIPLVAIADDLRHAAQEGGTDDQRAATLAHAAESTERLIDLFGLILEIGEINSVRVYESGRTVDLSDLVETLAGAHVAVAEDDGRTLTCSIRPGVSLFGIGDLLAQALINLIQNALTHTAPGAHIHIALAASGALAHLSVTDDGPGLSDADRGAVVADDRLSANRSGSKRAALGLKLVHAIVAAHHGRLSIENAGPGLRAIIELPRVRPTP